MESMLPVSPVKMDKKLVSTAIVRRSGKMLGCHPASGDPPLSLCSPGFKEALETIENSEGAGDSQSESVASEDIACPLESDASSNAISGDSLVSNGHSLAHSLEEKNLKRSPSGSSIVTYDEAVSKLREEGECERTVERKLARRAGGSRSNSVFGEQDPSISTVRKMTESSGPAWTDDKHCSYLNSIEASFVQSLYGQDYCPVDVSGQDDQDCVESRPMYPTYGSYPRGCELFTSLQRGCYDQREYYRPHSLNHFASSPAVGVFLSPWIQHFNPRIYNPSYGVSGSSHDAFPGHASAGFVDGAYCSGFGNGGVKEEVMESEPEIPELGTHGPHVWSSRYHSQHNASTSAPVRAETGNQGKRHPCNLDPNNGVVRRPKKHRSSRRSLAEIDLEMEEQFVLKQRKERVDDVEQTDDAEMNETNLQLGTGRVGPQMNDDEDLGVFKGNPHISPRAVLNGRMRFNTTQGYSAEVDEELDQQFCLKQKGEFVDNFDLNERLSEEGTVLDLNEQQQEGPGHMAIPQVVAHALPRATGESVELMTVCQEPIIGRDSINARIKEFGVQNHFEGAPLVEGNSNNDITVGEGEAGMALHCSLLDCVKSCVSEAGAKYQSDMCLDKEECDNLPKFSPRPSHTYTWGSIGTRRRFLHSEYNVLVEAAAHAESAKEHQ